LWIVDRESEEGEEDNQERMQEDEDEDEAPTHTRKVTVVDADDEEDSGREKDIPRGYTRLVAFTSFRWACRSVTAYSHQQVYRAKFTCTRQGKKAKTSRRPMDDTPFPQIRGTHLEKLFFSAPEHDKRTCNVCQRRGPGEGDWLLSRSRTMMVTKKAKKMRKTKGLQRDQTNSIMTMVLAWASKEKGREDAVNTMEVESEGGLIAKTVVARVIRELEDDFTCYKGLVFRLCSCATIGMLTIGHRIYVELTDQYKEMDAV